MEVGASGFVGLLIDAGADMEVTDRKGQTPLYIAVFNRHKDTVKLLLERGADPEGSQKNLNTPLCIAVMHKDVEILKVWVTDTVWFPLKKPKSAIRKSFITQHYSRYIVAQLNRTRHCTNTNSHYAPSRQHNLAHDIALSHNTLSRQYNSKKLFFFGYI